MVLLTSTVPRRRSLGGGSTITVSWTRVYILALCFVGGALVVFFSNQYMASAPFHRAPARRLRAGTDQPKANDTQHVIRSDRTRLVRRNPQITERFATLYHSELMQQYGFSKNGTTSITADLVAAIKNIERIGASTVILSAPWNWLQPDHGSVLVSRLDALIDAVCKNTDLKIAVILDLLHAPDWLFDTWPDAQVADSHWVSYKFLSWFHPDATRIAMAVLSEVVTHLVASFPGRVTAVQPAYNNAYEARYGYQENEYFEDYSPAAVAAFQKWLEGRMPELDTLNRRWGTNFSSWLTVIPPLLEGANLMGPDLHPRYWDFITFRELYGARALNSACDAVRSAGARCFHHVPELFTVTGAMYGSTMLKHIAASPSTDFLIVSSDFRSQHATPISPNKTWLGVAGTAAYGKPVYFEAAMAHAPPLDTVSAGMRLALAAGATGVGLSHWLDRLDPNSGTELPSVLQPALPACDVSESVGVFIHLDSCSAFHGLQRDLPRRDPVRDLSQDLAELLAERCDWSVWVYLELERLQRALPSLDRIIFVEPLVLLGPQQLELYARVKEAVRAMPHTFLQFGFNQTRGVHLAVMPGI